MKRIYLSIITIVIVISATAQNSVQDGNWTDPTTWDCNCVPAPYLPTAIDVTINHTVVADIYDIIFSLSGRTYFDGGSLTIGANGTLLQMGEGDLLMSNATTIVDGILDMRRIAIVKGTATYNGIIQNCDSLWNDSSDVINNGIVTTYDHQVFPTASMTNNGLITITNNMNIMGEYINSATGEIIISNDFSNANVLGGRALYTNNGSHTIHNNFLNTANDTIRGNTGTICIGNLSTNQGAILGQLVISTPTAGFSLNTGFVAPSVTFNNNPCVASIEDNKNNTVNIYPNPFINTINLEGIDSGAELEIFNVFGKSEHSSIINSDKIDLSFLNTGIYFLRIEMENNSVIVKKIIKR